MLPNNVLSRNLTREKYEDFDTEAQHPLTEKVFDQQRRIVVAEYVELETGKAILLKREDGDIRKLNIEDLGEVRNISLAYDQSDYPVYAFSYTDRNGLTHSRFSYYNSLTKQYVNMTIEDTSMCYVIMDELRPEFQANADIVFFYVRRSDSRVCFRYQRDRYQTEYLGPVMNTGEEIQRVGHSISNRIQIETLRVLYRLKYTYPATFDGKPILLTDGNPLWIVKERIPVSVGET